MPKIAASEVGDLLANLVDRSLVQYDPKENRYVFFDSMREYSLERLRDAHEAEALQRRHLDHYFDLAQSAEQKLNGPQQGEFLDTLDTEHHNLRVALQTSRSEDAQKEIGLKLAGSLYRFWDTRGHIAEGKDWLEAVLAHSKRRSKARVKALNGLGLLISKLGDVARADSILREALSMARATKDRQGTALSLATLGALLWTRGDASGKAFLEESIALGRELGDQIRIANSLNGLGLFEYTQGDYDSAYQHFTECLTLLRIRKDKISMAGVLNNLARIATVREDLANARTLYEECLAISRELGHKSRMAVVLTNLGVVAQVEGDIEQARALHEESLAIYRDIRDPRGAAGALANLGIAMFILGDQPACRACHEESLELYRTVEDHEGIAFALDSFAALAAQNGEFERAAKLMGAAEEARNKVGAHLTPIDEAVYKGQAKATRKALGAAFIQAKAAGKLLTIEAAADLATFRNHVRAGAAGAKASN
jgi:tetratricopeptide (TPR) repeat protein